MTEELKQKIKEEMNVLPKELQNAINAVGWGSISEEIGKKYLLSDSEIIDLQIETATLLVGYTNPSLYALNIENNIGLSKQMAEKITDEMAEKIFKPIKNILQENIKKNMANRTIDWKQNVNFVISGGDYSFFMQKMGTSNITETPKTNIPINSSRIEDIKNKFTI